VLGTPGRAALALGFSPWSNPAVAGGRHVLWHNGLGGSVGLAHTASHFSISVFACSLVFSRSLAIALSFSLALSLSSFSPLPPPPPPPLQVSHHSITFYLLARALPPQTRPCAPARHSPLPRQVLKNAYEPGVLGSHDGIVTLPDDVLELISVVETWIASEGAAAPSTVP
jgi:hypothetical protein